VKPEDYKNVSSLRSQLFSSIKKGNSSKKTQSFFTDPLNAIEHPIDFIENKAKSALNFVEHPINTTKAFFNDEETTAKNFIKNPIGDFTSGLEQIRDEIRAIPSSIETGFNDISYFADRVESTVKTVGEDIEKGAEWTWDEAKIVGGEIYDFGKGAINFGERTVQFIENYYQLLFMAGAVYMGARFYNEVKQVWA